jgi:DNA-binding IclR family transcriptional regulator
MSNIEDEIIKVMKQLNKPVSIETISILTKIPRSDVYAKMNSLEKYKMVKKKTAKKVYFWEQLL